ncbi:hypothetical protein DERF_012984 [Dermatophagoides farinae]|uniref:Uncharacterized protein n=1 Tax=Dermatophagoides farinae TaxID=6954 RepID=A0A922KXY9_DERFA|nr:hypothetical protein DERF_012984 [Dermatophagoides farinae]
MTRECLESHLVTRWHLKDNVAIMGMECGHKIRICQPIVPIRHEIKGLKTEGQQMAKIDYCPFMELIAKRI